MMNADGFAGFSRRQQRMGTRGISPVPGACYLLKSRRICNGFGVADHSKLAHYAGGLSVEEIAAQHREIEHLNKSFGKTSGSRGNRAGADGSLDYPTDVLARFDFVVASIHRVIPSRANGPRLHGARECGVKREFRLVPNIT
jgi:hypothetical protein